MPETFDEQLERVRRMADGNREELPDMCAIDEADLEEAALRAVLEQRDRMREALKKAHAVLQSTEVTAVFQFYQIHGCRYSGPTFSEDDYRAAIHPEEPE